MPSLPATTSCRMPSRSSSGSTTMVQALENAVWPVRPISQESQSVTRVPGGAVALGGQRGDQPARPRADHQHVGVDQHAVEIGLAIVATTAAAGSSPTDARRRCARGKRSRS